MIPTTEAGGTKSIPTSATFWMPRADDLDGDEGFGSFQGTWVIRNMPVNDAHDVVNEERRLVEMIDRIAADAEHFERLARAVEFGQLDDPEYRLTENERQLLGEFASDLPAELGGLELGVAGLAHALATVRILPAASCRSHRDPHTWSDAPVVYFAATEFRTRALQTLLQESGCTFAVDTARPNLVVVRGRSILNTMELADAVLNNRKSFVQPRGQRSISQRPPVASEQTTLW